MWSLRWSVLCCCVHRHADQRLSQISSLLARFVSVDQRCVAISRSERTIHTARGEMAANDNLGSRWASGVETTALVYAWSLPPIQTYQLTIDKRISVSGGAMRTVGGSRFTGISPPIRQRSFIPCSRSTGNKTRISSPRSPPTLTSDMLVAWCKRAAYVILIRAAIGVQGGRGSRMATGRGSRNRSRGGLRA